MNTGTNIEEINSDGKTVGGKLNLVYSYSKKSGATIFTRNSVTLRKGLLRL
jgi:hypothetical protein